MILKTSCMPLHISLGIGLKILNLIENEAVAIDCEIKTQNGEQTEEINELMGNLKQLSLEISSQNDKLSYINMELEIKQSKLQDFENENVSALHTSGKAFCEKTNKAREIQKQYKALKNNERCKKKIFMHANHSMKLFKNSSMQLKDCSKRGSAMSWMK